MKLREKLRCLVLTSLFLGLAAGCQDGKTEVETRLATKEQIQKWLAEYEITPNVPDRSSLDQKFRPERFLPKIHSWFATRGNLQRPMNLGSGWSIMKLRPIPPWVIADLDRILIDDTHRRVSFAVLTKSFWRQVQAAQNRVEIGFLSFDNSVVVSGVYFHSLKLVGLDIFSEPNTLPHELRHADQGDRLDKIARSHRPWFSPKVLERECLAVASGAFAEVDATSYELANHLHRGLENEFPVEPRCQALGNCETYPVPQYPNFSFFMVNMNYPVEAFKRILNEESCSEDFKQLTREIIAVQDVASNDLVDALAAVTRPSQAMATAYRVRAANRCDRQSSIACDQALEAFQRHASEIDTIRAAFTQKMAQERTERPKRLLQWTQRLPRDVKHDLCHFAKGFEFIADCKQVIR